MRDHPTLFTAPMVCALLADLKHQTRRVVTMQNSLLDGRWPATHDERSRLVFTTDGHPFPGLPCLDRGPSPAGNPGPYLEVPMRPHPQDNQDDAELWTVHRVYPRVHPGDRLWVKETFALPDDWKEFGGYEDRSRVDYRADRKGTAAHKWRPSIFMPRWASRILLEVTGIRVQRVQEITFSDCIAEGIEAERKSAEQLRSDYWRLWDEINGPRGYGWKANPWVWVYSFTRAGDAHA